MIWSLKLFYAIFIKTKFLNVRKNFFQKTSGKSLSFQKLLISIKKTIWNYSLKRGLLNIVVLSNHQPTVLSTPKHFSFCSSCTSCFSVSYSILTVSRKAKMMVFPLLLFFLVCLFEEDSLFYVVDDESIIHFGGSWTQLWSLFSSID